MDKSILKKFAIESRTDLMQKIESKIKLFYVDESFSKQQNGDLYVLSNGTHTLNLSKEEYDKRELLIKRINELGIEQVIEEAAYTWFNRIVAIRYMEINDYLPLTKDNQSLGIRVLSSKENTPDPEILKFTNLTNPELDINFKKEKYIELKDDNEKFKYILLLICKKLGNVIPKVFDGITDYIDILIPDNLLNDTGFITKIISEVSEDNFSKVEIIGWLYQYYISEKKDKAFKDLKNRIKLNKDSIPAATQLFTPDWIVKYLVENTLGKLWIDCNNDNALKAKWKYYINEEKINSDNRIIKPESIRVIDPCSGSGHILLYFFELFVDIYESLGFKKSDIPQYIINNNLYGIDLDDRAEQLSTLTVILKAREYDKNIFNKNLNLNILSIQESNSITFSDLDILFVNDDVKNIVLYIYNNFKDAKEYGSIIKTEKYDYQKIYDVIEELSNKQLDLFEYQKLNEIKTKLVPIIKQAELLSNTYDVVVTNPPYMGNKGMNNKLLNYTKKYYNDYKFDMFSVFIKRASDLTKNGSYYGLITQPSILFLSSFEELRNFILNEQCITSVLHMGRGIFGIDFGSAAFTIKKERNDNYYGKYFKLYDRTFQYIDCNDIEKIYLNTLNNENYEFDFSTYNSNIIDEEDDEIITKGISKILYKRKQELFKKIPTYPIAYWLSEEMINLFNEKKVGDLYTAKQGIITADTNRFLRRWTEIDFTKIGWNYNNKIEAKESKKKWFPYNKGGAYRKWYGNNEYLINWYNDGQELREYTDTLPQGSTARLKSQEYYFKESITWSLISSKYFGARYSQKGFLFDVGGSSIFSENNLKYLLGFLSTNIASKILKVLNPTMNCPIKDVKALPIIISEDYLNEVESLVDDCIKISKEDWDLIETSWDFNKPSLLMSDKLTGKIKDIAEYQKQEYLKRYNNLLNNEVKLNTIFNIIYNMTDEISNIVDDESISVRKFNIQDEIKNLISYAVGCMFGRYSLDNNGLTFAGGVFNYDNYEQYKVDIDNVIPITDEAYFADDIVARFKKFIDVIYGKETLNDNIDFIAEALGKRGTETSEDTIRRYFLNDFYNDHIKMYQKKPIYWLFDSGKKNGFKALIYMHRYDENTIPKVRLDYLHRIQTTYEKLLTDVNYKLTTELSLNDKKEAQKRQADLNAKLTEIKEYDEKIAHIANQRISIDLDDGVSVNYSKFADILAKIK